MNKIYSSLTNSKFLNLSFSQIFRLLLALLGRVFGYLVYQFSYLFIKPRRIVIVGSDEIGFALYNFFNSRKSYAYQFMGFYGDKLTNSNEENNLEDFKNYCLQNKIDEIYFTLPLTQQDLLSNLTDFAEKNFIYFRIATEAVQNNFQHLPIFYIDEIPVLSMQQEPLSSRTNQIIKRGFDIGFSLLALLFLVPFIFPLIALAIRWESKGPIFFVQKRPGIKNQHFGCIKFRTMRVNTQNEMQAKKNDHRITKVGAFLRKTSLDELPQFFNVLRGDMSIVGPRPNMIKQLETYSQMIDKYSSRHFVKPGITGYAQVSGYRGETETVDLMEKRVEYDLLYIQNWNFWWDVKIIFQTVLNIFKGEDRAY